MRCSFNAWLSVLAFVMSAACTTACGKSERAVNDEQRVGAGKQDTSALIVDRFDDFFPDSADRTVVFMTEFQRLISQYRMHTGRLPPELESVLDGRMNETQRQDAVRDAWGRRFEYVGTDSVVQLRSAGPDRTFSTSDDIIRRWQF
jgi:hypothetical protein